jgi:hypothetical protein
MSARSCPHATCSAICQQDRADSSSVNEISTIASLNNEFFYKHFFEDWSDSESDDDFDLMVALASILHEEN